jgi:hypothetical protein
MPGSSSASASRPSVLGMRGPDRAVHWANNINGKPFVLRKILIGVAIAFSAVAGIATPAGADPSPFGTLGCSCTPPVAVPDGKAPAGNPMDQGIQNGLGYLRDIPSRHADN